MCVFKYIFYKKIIKKSQKKNNIKNCNTRLFISKSTYGFSLEWFKCLKVAYYLLIL